MSSKFDTFATAVGCMDGRVQEPVFEFAKKRWGVKYVDTITEAGLVGLLASNDPGSLLLDSIKKKVLISVEKHHSKGIVVHGHEDCAGNPVSDSQQKEEIISAADIIRELEPGVEVVSVFVKRAEPGWEVIPL